MATFIELETGDGLVLINLDNVTHIDSVKDAPTRIYFTGGAGTGRASHVDVTDKARDILKGAGGELSPTGVWKIR